MSKHTETVFVLRDRKTGRYYKFDQYCEDGWGEHRATESTAAAAKLFDSFTEAVRVRDSNLTEQRPARGRVRERWEIAADCEIVTVTLSYELKD